MTQQCSVLPEAVIISLSSAAVVLEEVSTVGFIHIKCAVAIQGGDYTQRIVQYVCRVIRSPVDKKQNKTLVYVNVFLYILQGH